MNAAVIPEPIAQLQLQLNEIRSTRPRGKRLPDSVWQAAVELAREHRWISYPKAEVILARMSELLA